MISFSSSCHENHRYRTVNLHILGVIHILVNKKTESLLKGPALDQDVLRVIASA